MKWTIRKKINLLLITCILLMITVITIVSYTDAKNNLIETVNAKLLSDIDSSYEYLDAKIPGDWHIKNNELHKGDVKIVGNFDIVDKLSNLTHGDAITIFQYDTRVSTNIIENGERAINTKVINLLLSKRGIF